jgi:hypothetical protein
MKFTIKHFIKIIIYTIHQKPVAPRVTAEILPWHIRNTIQQLKLI